MTSSRAPFPFLSMVSLVTALTVTMSVASADAARTATDTHSAKPRTSALPLHETPQDWYRNGALRAAGNGAMQGRACNVILFLGDGMSLTTVAAARILEGQRKGGTGEENQLSWERFPNTALSKTYNVDSQTPDSAGAMTAITTGVKSHMGAIGVSADARDDCGGSLDRHLLT